MFIGSTDTEAEALILWPPDAKSRLTGKDPDAGKVTKGIITPVSSLNQYQELI